MPPLACTPGRPRPAGCAPGRVCGPPVFARCFWPISHHVDIGRISRRPRTLKARSGRLASRKRAPDRRIRAQEAAPKANSPAPSAERDESDEGLGSMPIWWELGKNASARDGRQTELPRVPIAGTGDRFRPGRSRRPGSPPERDRADRAWPGRARRASSPSSRKRPASPLSPRWIGREPGA